ncbi:MAG: STAS domain-containing protein [Gemmatimonadota bacterium]
MKMVIARNGDLAVVRLAGRLDGEWAEHLSDTLDDLLREGLRSVTLEASGVDYVSSAGAQVLATRFQEFTGLRGELRVLDPSPAMLAAVTQAGLEERILLDARASVSQRRLSSGTNPLYDYTRDSWLSPVATPRQGHYEVSSREPDATLACRMYGDPALLTAGGYGPQDCSIVDFPESAFGLGVGAIGGSWEEGSPRIGELAAAAGIVTYLPTDGGFVPDYLHGLRGSVPRALLASGLTCQGRFSHLIRFHSQADADAVPLAELARMCIDTTGGDTVGMVALAETAGLIGASLHRPPLRTGERFGFDVPEVRNWISFTPERAYEETTALVVGVVSRTRRGLLEPHLRPLIESGPSMADQFISGHQIAERPPLFAHFHAVILTYRPIPQRTVALAPLLARLFSTQRVRTVLHLLDDDRGGAGAGANELSRGLCWTSPITSVQPAA